MREGRRVLFGGDEAEALAAEQDAMDEDVRKALAKARDEMLKAEKKAADAAAKERNRANDAALREQEQWARSMASTFDFIGDAAAQALTSPLDAVAALGTAIAQATGDFVTLKGGEMVASGLAQIATGPAGVPSGTAAIAAGLGVVAAGQTIRVGGAAAIGALTGQAGSSSPSSASRDPGAAPRRSPSGGASGGLTVNVAYGVAGPRPEDTARAIAAALKTGDRRGVRR